MKKGAFREDLYFRLNVVAIRLPPLRERVADIPKLAQAFLQEFSQEINKALKGFTPDAMDLMLRYSWPGNVRELRTAVEHAVVLCRGERLGARDLPPALRQPAAQRESPAIGASSLAVEEAEKELIIRALKQSDGSRTLAAKKLDISRRTLYRKLAEYKLEGY